MVIRATAINPELLRWARERAGYSVEDIARRRRVSPERVREWESGKSFPTWRQFEQLSHQDYHRGTVFFFFKDPPEEKTVTERFHRLPAEMLEDLHPDTLYAVRQARYRQDDLTELLGADGTGERFILRDLRGYADAGNPGQLAMAVREYLGIDPENPEGISNLSHPFEDFRSLVEDAGVWVFKRSFRQKDLAGFCLGDDVYPVIYVNHGETKERQIFTLFNGLAHLLLDFNYLERKDKRHYLKALTGAEKDAEKTCHVFGEEFEAYASKCYSRDSLMLEMPSTDESVRGRRGYYDFQKAFLGKKYIRTVFQSFEEGHIEELDIAAFLGVRGIHLDELEGYAWQP